MNEPWLVHIRHAAVPCVPTYPPHLRCRLQKKDPEEAEGLLRGAMELIQKGPARDTSFHAFALCDLARLLMTK